MGICSSGMTAETRHSNIIDLKISREREDDAAKVKLLLLGGQESGRSTLFKQFRLHYGKHASSTELKAYVLAIHHTIMTSMQTLLSRQECQLLPSSLTAERHDILAWQPDMPYTGDLGKAITALWMNDQGVKAAFAARTRFTLSDGAQFFFEKAIAVSAPGYTPTVDDVLRVRKPVTAVAEDEYWIEHVLFHIVHVGGQRNERKKWVHHFEGVTAVAFVASLADYDGVLDEDPTMNRLTDALELFSDIVNSRWFENSIIILLLNKKDIFEKKIQTIDLRHEGDKANNIIPRFLDYNGGCNANEALRYILGRFQELMPPEPGGQAAKLLYSHYTCATDLKACKHTIRAVKEEIMRETAKTRSDD